MEDASKPSRLALRVLIGLVVLYAAITIIRVIMGVGPNLLMRQFGASEDFRAYIGSTLNYGVGIAAYLLLPALAMRKVLGLDARPRFFPAARGWWQDLLFGLLLVAAVLFVFFVIELQAGWLALDGWRWQALSRSAWLRAAWVGLLVNVGVAIGEETVFRGYLLTGLQAAWGKWTALIAMTVIFGLFHLPAYLSIGWDPGALTLAIILASLFGLLFGLAYLRTGTLWLPAALHYAWNFVENDVLNQSADSTNPNLIGALTSARISPLRGVALEMLAFCVIALGVWLWLGKRQLSAISSQPSARPSRRA